MRARDREHLRDVVGRLGVDDEVGQVGRVEREVARVQLARGVAVADAIGAERGLELVAQEAGNRCR